MTPARPHGSKTHSGLPSHPARGPRPTGHEDFTAVSASTLHFVDMLVYSDRIVLRAIDQDGMVVDMFTLRR
jgi:hypothetical protein